MGLENSIISGPDKSYKNIWGDNVFVSRPFYKIVLANGLGFYILNAHNYNLLPRFYGNIKKDFWEFGFYFAGWIFEIMWNKSFKI